MEHHLSPSRHSDMHDGKKLLPFPKKWLKSKAHAKDDGVVARPAPTPRAGFTQEVIEIEEFVHRETRNETTEPVPLSKPTSALLAQNAPQSVDLLLAADEWAREDKLKQRQWRHRLTLGLVVAAIVLIVLGWSLYGGGIERPPFPAK